LDRPGGEKSSVPADAVYGPAIWLVMSLAVISLLSSRPPAFNFRWWVQFVGHIPFVAVPMVAMISRPAGNPASDGGTRAAASEHSVMLRGE
jgi:uncharacterized membrane protein YagU involved in acid resistance